MYACVQLRRVTHSYTRVFVRRAAYSKMSRIVLAPPTPDITSYEHIAHSHLTWTEVMRSSKVGQALTTSGTTSRAWLH